MINWKRAARLRQGGESGGCMSKMSLMENIKQKRCYFAFDYDTELTSIAETDKYKTNVLTDGNIITAGADISNAWKCCSSQVLLVQRSTSVIPRTHLYRVVHRCRVPPNCTPASMTKELTHTFHDDSSSRRRRGESCMGGKKVVGAGVPAP